MPFRRLQEWEVRQSHNSGDVGGRDDGGDRERWHGTDSRGGTVVTLSQLAGAFQLVAGIVMSESPVSDRGSTNVLYQAGNGSADRKRRHDSARALTEDKQAAQFAFYGLMNPYATESKNHAAAE